MEYSLPEGTVDFNTTMSELRTMLLSTDTWSGVVDNQAGTAILNFLATISVFAQNKVIRAAQEPFPESCLTERASYALASLQGIRLSRKSPASCTVTLSSTTNVSTPAYHSFTTGSTLLFSRDPLVFVANLPQVVTLYEGEPRLTELKGLGSDYQMFIPIERDFVLSDSDVRVVVGLNEIPRTDSGLWLLPDQAGFQDRTLPDGRLAVTFGTDVYGTKPKSSETVLVLTVLTRGSSANSIGSLNDDVYSTTLSSVSGKLITSLSGGSDQRSPIEYKNSPPGSFGTFGAAVTPSQYKNTSRGFPGVIDAITFSQRDVDPTDVTWMNLVKVVPLTETPMNSTQKAEYLEYMENRTMYSTRFYLEDPVPYLADVSVVIYCYRWANPVVAKNNVIDKLTSLFALRKGSLSYDIYLSDISDAIRKADSSIAYFEILSPTTNLIVSAKPPKAPTLSLASGGSLIAGSYTYGLAVSVATTTGMGYIKLRNTSTITRTSTGSIKLTWDPIPNANEYHVYGRTVSGFGLLANVLANQVSWTDNGSVTPGATPPTKDVHPVQYLTLNSLNIEAGFTSRT